MADKETIEAPKEPERQPLAVYNMMSAQLVADAIEYRNRQYLEDLITSIKANSLTVDPRLWQVIISVNDSVDAKAFGLTK